MNNKEKLEFAVKVINAFLDGFKPYSYAKYWHVWKKLEFVAEFKDAYRIDSKIVYTDKEGNKYDKPMTKFRFEENSNTDNLVEYFTATLIRHIKYAIGDLDIEKIYNGTAKFNFMDKDSKSFNESIKLSKDDQAIVEEINKYYKEKEDE